MFARIFTISSLPWMPLTCSKHTHALATLAAVGVGAGCPLRPLKSAAGRSVRIWWRSSLDTYGNDATSSPRTAAPWEC